MNDINVLTRDPRKPHPNTDLKLTQVYEEGITVQTLKELTKFSRSSIINWLRYNNYPIYYVRDRKPVVSNIERPKVFKPVLEGRDRVASVYRPGMTLSDLISKSNCSYGLCYLWMCENDLAPEFKKKQ